MMASSAPKKHEAGTLQSAAETPDKGMTGLAASVADEWDSEKKLVSALSQLQDLDSKVCHCGSRSRRYLKWGKEYQWLFC